MCNFFIQVEHDINIINILLLFEVTDKAPYQ